MSFQERLAIIIEANAGKAIAEFKKVGTAAKEAGVSADGGAKGLSRFGIAGQTATNLLKGGIAIAVAAATTAIVKFAVDGVTAFVELTGEIRQFQRVSGASAEDASKLVALVSVLGIDSDAAAKAVFKLAVNIGTGNKAFAESGVVVAKLRNGNVDLIGTILNIGDAYKATGDATKRADLVAAAFGSRQGQVLQPLLGKTRQEIEAIFKSAEGHGLIFSQEQIDKGKEFALATRELGEAFKGIQVAVGETLVPFLTDLAIALTKVADAAHGHAIQSLFAAFATTVPGVGVLAGLVHVLAGNEGDAAREAAAAAAAIGDQATNLDALKKSIFTATDAQHSYEAAGRSVEAANRTLTKATADYNKLLKEGKVDAQKVADAQRSLAEATRSVGHAQREQTKAQGEYNEALAAFNILGTDTARDKLTDASNNLADANDNVADSQDRQKAAQADLDKAKAGDPDYQQHLADAKQNVADATQGVADAEYNLGKNSQANIAAHDAETKALSDKADQAERLLADYTALIAQHPELAVVLAPQIADVQHALATSPSSIPVQQLGPTVVGPPGPGDVSPAEFANRTRGWGGVPASTMPAATNQTNNVTINTTVGADARAIAREVIWNLN